MGKWHFIGPNGPRPNLGYQAVGPFGEQRLSISGRAKIRSSYNQAALLRGTSLNANKAHELN
eukprot:scaffold241941_cov59-Attheya_sp.AAC.1